MSNDITPTATGSLAPAVASMSADAVSFARQALATNTRRTYAAQLKLWAAHCETNGIAPFPADAVAIANWLASRAASGAAPSSLKAALAAVKFGHTAKGLHFDSQAPAVAAVLKGIRRESRHVPAQAEPIRGADVAAVLDSLPSSALALRDGALLALGFVFATRRSELVALDLGKIGDGNGAVRITAATIEMVLAKSKTNTGEPEVVTVPRSEVAGAIAAIEDWIAFAGIKPGEPLIRSVGKGGHIEGRLHPQSVPKIIKKRMAAYFIGAGVHRDTAEADAAAYSGHSLRTGFAVTAAEKGAGLQSIASVTRHKSLEMPKRYAAKAEALKMSPFKFGLFKPGA